MACFRCGKQISFLRRRSDADFCSDAHRTEHFELLRIGLSRIEGAEREESQLCFVPWAVTPEREDAVLATA